jgi:hypothetical protein
MEKISFLKILGEKNIDFEYSRHLEYSRHFDFSRLATIFYNRKVAEV